MFAIFLESFLLSIAKHGVEGRELQVAGRLQQDGGKARHGDQDSLNSLVAVARGWFLHIVSEMASDSTNLPPKQTPLYAEHLKLGAKMIDFGGWNMPVFYSSILEEHQAVRERVGIFDISHMGQIRVSGPSAEHWLNTLLTNNLQRLQMSDGQYTLLLNEQGGVIDDLIVYCRGSNDYFLVVNAAKIEEDFSWMQSHLSRRSCGFRPQRSLCCSCGARSWIGRIARTIRRFADPKSNPGIPNPRYPCLAGANRLHRGGRIRAFLSRRSRRSGLESSPGHRRPAWSETMRTGSARHPADGSLLSVERSGPLPDPDTARSRSRFFCRPRKTGICRTKPLACAKGSGPETAPRRTQGGWKISSAASPLWRFRRRRAGGRTDERHPISQPRDRNRFGLYRRSLFESGPKS